MLHDIVYTLATDKEFDVIDSHAGRKLHASPRFFHAKMINGVIDVSALAAEEDAS
jgi:hypothetical protein